MGFGVAILFGVLSLIYWHGVVEPMINTEVDSVVELMAGSQAAHVGEVLQRCDQAAMVEELDAVLNRILLYRDSMGTPFIQGVEIIPAHALFTDCSSEYFPFVRGNVRCPSCKLTEVPVYYRDEDRLLATLRFYCNTICYTDFRRNVFGNFLGGAVIATPIFLLVWWIGVVVLKPLSTLASSVREQTQSALPLRLPSLPGVMIREIRWLVDSLQGFFLFIQATTESIVENEEKIRLLLNSTGEGIYGIDVRGNCSMVNLSCLKLLGYDDESEVLGKNMHELIHHADEQGRRHPAEKCKILSSFRTGEHVSRERDVFWRKDNTFLEVEYWSTPIVKRGKITGAVITFFDISERNKAELELKASLMEKEVLLKEIHHRVKNNMQIISSLLYLQSQKSSSEEAREVLRDSRGRVRSMALIHEKLYRSGSLSQVHFADYIRDLMDYIRRSHLVGKGIVFEVESNEMSFPIHIAIPCGLIVNELVTNCIKHAFGSGSIERPWVRITMRAVGLESVSLSVEDNGRGLPEGMEMLQTLGVTLVKSLTYQVGGSCIFTNTDHGARCEITLPLEEGE